MLDMDGTILDLAFDNYVWRQLVPERYATHNGLDYEIARERLYAKYASIQGDLEWYCLDHWSERLGFDVLGLHQEVHHRIEYLPGARAFLERVREMDVQVLLVTNSHPDTLHLKESTLGFSDCFDGLHSSHIYGHAKESQKFWHALYAAGPAQRCRVRHQHACDSHPPGHFRTNARKRRVRWRGGGRRPVITFSAVSAAAAACRPAVHAVQTTAVASVSV